MANLAYRFPYIQVQIQETGGTDLEPGYETMIECYALVRVKDKGPLLFQITKDCFRG